MSIARLRPAFARPSFTSQPRATLRRTFISTPQTQQQQSGNQVTIVEVGPRDGLQNEKKSIPVETKIELVERLARTGLRTIEAGSFVSPKWTPQMASSDKILSHILQTTPQSPVPIAYQWLLPNMRGLETYFKTLEQNNSSSSSQISNSSSAYPTPPSTPPPEDSTVPNTSSANPSASSLSSSSSSSTHQQPTHEISLFLAATESFSLRNTNCSISESLSRFKPLITTAKSRPTHPTRVRAYISVALGCPYEGPDVSPHKVAELAASLLKLGADEISVADTTGMGTVPRTRELLRVLAASGIRNEDLALHFHDTYGMALANTVVGLEAGVRTFDSAVGGLGGCPYSPGATGNVATEDLVYLMHSLGMETGIDLEEVSKIGEWITGEIGKGNESRAGKATLARARMQASEGMR